MSDENQTYDNREEPQEDDVQGHKLTTDTTDMADEADVEAHAYDTTDMVDMTD